MREESETFSWQNLVQLSGTNAWDDTHGGYHMVVRICTQMLLIAMVYPAVVVIMMVITIKSDETFYHEYKVSFITYRQ